jgi:hypothetical protein
MIMIWIIFIIGLIITFGGCVIQASEENIKYKSWSFNAEDLGRYLIWLGGATSAAMIVGIFMVTVLKILT